MARVSAGLLMCQPAARGGGMLLVHPGGPFYVRRDHGCWSIPKGLVESGETLLKAAKREFTEELGWTPDTEEFIELGSITQAGRKVVHAWAFQGDWNPAELESVTFELEWPPNSGKLQTFPEVDRAAFFGFEEAKARIIPAQVPLLERARDLVSGVRMSP